MCLKKMLCEVKGTISSPLVLSTDVNKKKLVKDRQRVVSMWNYSLII